MQYIDIANKFIIYIYIYMYIMNLFALSDMKPIGVSSQLGTKINFTAEQENPATNLSIQAKSK